MTKINQRLSHEVSVDNLLKEADVEVRASSLNKVIPEHMTIKASEQFSDTKIAVLIPCYNEAISINKVITDFRNALPGAVIYVYDNRSTDNTASIAREAGAIVRNEPWPGKGNVVRRMFADIEADVYVMADGDATYDAAVAPVMVSRLLEENLDMVVGIRKNVYSNAHRTGHGLGNKLFNEVYRSLFGPMFSDIFSGYRVFSRRFVKSFPSISSGFEIETEMSVHASQVRMPVAEIETDYGAREVGSVSKLRTFHDAFRILRTLFMLFKEIKPAKFFGVIAGSLAIISLLLGYPLLQTYMQTGLVPRFPTAILITGLMLLSAISLVAGLILDSVARGRLENKRMIYLGLVSPALKDL
jgi:glycosyltransferase involved in cell wall biosynthesis